MNSAESSPASDVPVTGPGFYFVLLGVFALVAAALAFIYAKFVDARPRVTVKWTALEPSRPRTMDALKLDVRVVPDLSRDAALPIGVSDDLATIGAQSRLLGQVRVSRSRPSAEKLVVGIDYLRSQSKGSIDVELDRDARTAIARYRMESGGWTWTVLNGTGRLAITSWDFDSPLVLDIDLEGQVAKSDRVDPIALKKNVKISLE